MAEANLQNNGGNGNGQSIQEKYGDRANVDYFFDRFTLSLEPLKWQIAQMSDDDNKMEDASILYAAYKHARESIGEMIEAIDKKFGRTQIVFQGNPLSFHGFDRGDILGVEVKEPVTEQQQEVDHD